MAKATSRGRKPSQNETAELIGKVLKFTGIAAPSGVNSQAWQTSTFFGGGWAAATNGVLTAATPANVGFDAFVDTKQLADAVSNVGKNLAITVMPTGGLSITSDKYEAIVITCDEPFPAPQANPMVAPLTKVFIDAFVTASLYTKDTADKMIQASILLNGQTLVGTDTAAIVEAWHGINMPAGLVFPKAFGTALAKAGKVPTGFGFDGTGFTVHFDDGSWLRTNLYTEPWPSLDRVMSNFDGEQLGAVPDGLFAALKAVEGFADEDRSVFFGGADVYTHEEVGEGAKVTLKTDHGIAMALNIDKVLKAEDLCTTVSFSPASTGKNMMFFMGMACENTVPVRGMIMGLKYAPPVAAAVPGEVKVLDWGAAPQAAPADAPAPAWEVHGAGVGAASPFPGVLPGSDDIPF